MKKRIVPFNGSMFLYAVRGLLGRKADHYIASAEIGELHLTYFAVDKEEQLFMERVDTIKEWLDNFNIIFSKTTVEFDNPKFNEVFDGKKTLVISVGYPVKIKKKKEG